MKTILFVLALFAAFIGLCLLPSPAAKGGEYYNGQVHYSNGVTYAYNGSDGYWYSGSQPYTRTRIYYPQEYSYNYYGCKTYQPTYYYYSYTPVYSSTYTAPAVTPAYTAPAPTAAASYAAADWRSRLLDIAKERDKLEGSLRKADLDQRAYLQAIHALGLNGNFHMPGYGSYSVQPSAPYPLLPGQNGYPFSTAPFFSPHITPSQSGSSYQGSYGSTTLSTAGVQGNTVYGYNMYPTPTVNDLKALAGYGTLDLNTLYSQSERLAQTAGGLYGQAQNGHMGLVGKAGDNAARVAEILARAQAAQAVMRAMDLPPTSTSTTTYGSIGGSTGGSVGGSVGISGVLGGAPSVPGSEGYGTPTPISLPPGSYPPGTIVPPMDPIPAPAAIPGTPYSSGVSGAGPASGPNRFMALVGNPRCGKCHSGSSLKGSFDIATYTRLNPEQKRLVWSRVLSADPKKRMPPDKPLTPDELREFLLH